MTHRAARGEGSRDGEEDDFLVGPFLGCIVVDRNAAGGDFGGLGGVGDITRDFSSATSGIQVVIHIIGDQRTNTPRTLYFSGPSGGGRIRGKESARTRRRRRRGTDLPL